MKTILFTNIYVILIQISFIFTFIQDNYIEINAFVPHKVNELKRIA